MLDHLSYSSINSYLNCHRGWRFKYIDQVPALESTTRFFGGVFHEAVGSHILSKGNITESWAAAWESKLAELDGQINWGEDTPVALCNEGIRILTHEDIFPVIDALKPLVIENKPAIERHVELRVPGVPVPIIGYIDMIEVDGVPVDFKTTGKSWSQNRAQSELQPLFYLAALNQGGWDLGWQFRHYVFVRNKKPKCDVWNTQRSLSEVFWLFGLIRECWKNIQRGNFAPTGAGSFLCSERYCDYWGMCRGKS